MRLSSLHIDEALDIGSVRDLDPDPDFRTLLHLLNSAGIQTTSSCQGHAPGTQYDEVQEWMNPYITCRVTEHSNQKVKDVLEIAGAKVKNFGRGFLVARFPRGWDWSHSVALLRRSATSGLHV